ncbi:MAG: xanthine phosphoribosyltransferase [Spirochaetaceae bacterium]|jgi:xanthine phosphoribosyltransferase|nr:xanthine phosphoribosyltransferase [Spirochaetaceae bacterium]
MKLLEDRIIADAKVLRGDILNVGSFLNQQVDIGLFKEIGEEFARRFLGKRITRILTVETSGMGIACITAQYFNNVPVVFARKHRTKNMSNNVYSANVTSFTTGIDYTVTVSREYLQEDDSVLLIDDFLANGHALEGLVTIVKEAGAALVGAGVVIEKGFQDGGKRLRSKDIPIESLAIIESMSPEGGIQFRAS